MHRELERACSCSPVLNRGGISAGLCKLSAPPNYRLLQQHVRQTEEGDLNVGEFTGIHPDNPEQP